jgi:hypothetical protein
MAMATATHHFGWKNFAELSLFECRQVNFMSDSMDGRKDGINRTAPDQIVQA